MQVKIFTIPLLAGETLTEEMNQFLRSQRVIEIDKQIVMQNHVAFWSFCITYLPVGGGTSGERREKVDYKQVLAEREFAVFSRLRMIRKQLADSDAVPAYAVFTDAELAEMAKIENIDIAKMRAIPGIGAKKMEKYGVEICKILSDEESRFSD